MKIIEAFEEENRIVGQWHAEVIPHILLIDIHLVIRSQFFPVIKSDRQVFL